jgi:FO synthase
LESASLRLCRPGGPHEHAPSKRPQARLKTLRLAGELKIPFTTGLLIGIGETAQERLEALIALRELQQQYGHIQELIIQNFRAKPATPMEHAPEASIEATLECVATARVLFGGDINIQVPPNLTDPGAGSYAMYLKAGINDWGGISPVTIDYVNPEAPWPHLNQLRQEINAWNFQLRARFPVYPEYIFERSDYLPEHLRARLRRDADPQGYVRDTNFEPALSQAYAGIR